MQKHVLKKYDFSTMNGEAGGNFVTLAHFWRGSHVSCVTCHLSPVRPVSVIGQCRWSTSWSCDLCWPMRERKEVRLANGSGPTEENCMPRGELTYIIQTDIVDTRLNWLLAVAVKSCKLLRGGC